MVVDSSAVMAILQGEPESARLTEAIESAAERLISAVSVLEIGILALSRKGERGVAHADALLAAVGLEIVAFDREQAAVAREAFARYGKGRHAAALNFGDCAAYALAAARGLPLLYKGGAFARTDIRPALAP
jgi:ribonuclease VapC